MNSFIRAQAEGMMDVRREREHCLPHVQESLRPWETVRQDRQDATDRRAKLAITKN